MAFIETAFYPSFKNKLTFRRTDLKKMQLWRLEFVL